MTVQQDSSLLIAALEGNVDEVSRLLASGCDPDAGDRQGFVALHFAAQEYFPGIVRLLLESGATVDAENDWGNTPLWTAVFNSQGRGEVIELLREWGADPTHMNRSGRTPLNLARLIGDSDVGRF